MANYMCPFCGVVSNIDTSKPKKIMSVWERDCMISGICENCYEKTFNVPTRAHSAEWGGIVRYCPVCDCQMYEKDMDTGKCPSCYTPVSEFDSIEENEDDY